MRTNRSIGEMAFITACILVAMLCIYSLAFEPLPTNLESLAVSDNAVYRLNK